MVRYTSRKKILNGEIVPDKLKLIQTRLPESTVRVYKTLLVSKNVTVTSHLEEMIINFIREEKKKLRENNSEDIIPIPG